VSRRLTIALVVAVGALVACRGDDELLTNGGPPWAMNPPIVAMRAGDTTSLRVTGAVPTSSYSVSFAWTMRDSTIARLGRVDSGGRRVLLRGGAPGQTALEFSVSSGGQTVTGSVPVTVN
jgi:hypothetical protein